MPKLLLVDGYSLLYRAFFSSPPFSTKAGEPTGALYGFARMLTRLFDQHSPDYVVVAIDAPGGTFRHEADATYKANRSEAPDDLKIQQKLVREMLDGLSIPRYEHAGFEADDVIGTLACHGVQQGQEVIIVTGDGDQLQLAAPTVQVMLTRKGVSELDIYGPQEVIDRYGFEPKFIPDFKGLKGDASDNIPGVPGIGDKTASSLLQKFGSLAGIFENLDEVKPPRIQNLLREHREQAIHSRQMAVIVTDLPIDAQPEDFRYDPIDPEKRQKAAQTARRFEFKSLAARFETPLETAQQAPIPSKEFEFEWSETGEVNEALSWIEKRGAQALIGLSHSEDGLFLSHENQVLLFRGDLKATTGQMALDFAENSAPSLQNWLEDAQASKIVHDSKALMRAWQKQEIHLRGVVADTLLMGYLIEPGRQQHPLDFLAGKFLKTTLPAPPAPKKKSKNASLFEDENPDDESAIRKTAQAARTAILGDLEAVLQHELEEIGHKNLFAELEMPLVPVLAQMEKNGMQLDPQQLRDLGKKLETDAARLQGEIWEAAGVEFNIGSPKQLAEVLFEKLELEKGRKNKSGGYSTDAFILERLAQEHDVVRKILDYRGTIKLKSTYIDALLSLMDKETHRIHSSLNQTGTVTGRISSSDPNLQNVPIRTEQGRLIRKAFIARPGHVILSADYSQIELRILAHITGDAPLVDAFANDEDVHARTAAALFGVAVEDVDNEMRRKAKMTNYAIAYGVSGFGLAKQLGTGTGAEAQEFIKTYFETLPGVKRYIDETLEAARKSGYVETLLGRKRPVPDITANAFQVRSAAERTAINHPIQGTAADMMKIAMLAVAAEIEKRGLQTLMTMQVHDELVFEVPENEVEETSELVERLMSEVPARRLNLKVPLGVDVGTGPNWNATKGKAEVVEVPDEFEMEVS